MVVYEIVGGVVFLLFLGLGVWKFTELMQPKKGRGK